MHSIFYHLKHKKIQKKTADAVSLLLEVPADLKDTFQYTQGQYLTLRFNLKGKEERRAYSMCSSPLEPDLAVTVIRLPGGLVSNYIQDNIKAGDTIEVMPPEGRFFTPLAEHQKKTYYLIGAGSGITPLFSILKTILEAEPQSTVNLLYGNRDEDHIIFLQALDQMAQRYAGQLHLRHTLSQPKREKGKGLSGFFSKGTIAWQGPVGRIEPKVLEKFLADFPAVSSGVEYFICGPGAMIDSAEALLLKRGVDKKNIHSERFLSSVPTDASAAGNIDGALVKVHLDGSVHTVTVPAGKTILATLLEKKMEAPYSCTSGACSTCMAKVLHGSVKMDACYALDDDEVAQGYILTCQSHPQTPEVELTYEV